MKISQGFTLIEMAIVLLIMGFLMGGLFMPLSMQMNQQKIKDTERTLETIKDALIGYAVINGNLPCPALDKGGHESSTNPCTTYNNSDGYLPWADLGVNKYDAWGNIFRYRLDGSFSDSIPNPIVVEHELEIRDVNKVGDGNLLSSFENIATDTNSNVVAIIYSCGKNGIPNKTNAISEYSGANCSTASSTTSNNVYTKDGYVEDKFDDILVWLPKTILINQLVLAGKWPP